MMNNDLLTQAVPQVVNKYTAQSKNLGNSPQQQKNYAMKARQVQLLALQQAYGQGHSMQQLGQGTPYGK